jgi:hypothetical protein
VYVCQLKDKENNILEWWQAYYRFKKQAFLEELLEHPKD